MHFTTLYLLKGTKLEDINAEIIDQDFCDRFCYCCGETRPRYRYWCDWFQIGGRWAEPIVAKRGLLGSRSWCNENEKRVSEKHFAIAEIKDIENELDDSIIYAIATKSRIYTYTDNEYHKLLKKINNKEIKGVVAFIDCHD